MVLERADELDVALVWTDKELPNDLDSEFVVEVEKRDWWPADLVGGWPISLS